MIRKIWRWRLYVPFLWSAISSLSLASSPSGEMNLRPFLNWVYQRQPQVHATLWQCSDETLESYSERLAKHIIFSQSVESSSDIYSPIRQAEYQRTLLRLLKEDQRKQKQKKAEHTQSTTAQGARDIEDTTNVEQGPALRPTWNSPLKAFLLKAESEDRHITRKLREHQFLHADPHSPETLKALSDAVYDEILHRMYLFTQYAESLCLHDHCVQKIQTILSSDMENFMKVKQIFPLLKTLENSNIKYASYVYSDQSDEEQWVREHIKLPGANLEYTLAKPERTEVIRKVLGAYPDTPQAQQVYQKLCLAFLAQIMGELSLDAGRSNSLLVLMMDAAADLCQTWDLNQFKHLLMHWPNTAPNHEILQKHLEKLGRVLPIALRHTQEWPVIISSCDAEYKKIIQIVAKSVGKP